MGADVELRHSRGRRVLIGAALSGGAVWIWWAAVTAADIQARGFDLREPVSRGILGVMALAPFVCGVEYLRRALVDPADVVIGGTELRVRRLWFLRDHVVRWRGVEAVIDDSEATGWLANPKLVVHGPGKPVTVMLEGYARPPTEIRELVMAAWNRALARE